MKKKIKLLKEYEGHEAGSLLEVDEATYKELIDEGIGEAIKEEDEKSYTKSMQKALIDNATKAAVEAVQAELRNMAGDGSKMIHISVKDRSDDDPCHGYLPGNSKELKDLTPQEINYAFGNFAADVLRATKGREPERLMKSRERSEQMIKKAAGDGLIVSSDQDGGYLIFSAASRMIQTASLEQAIIRPQASKVSMSTQILRMPYLRDTTHSSGMVYGGIQVYFDDELDQYTASKPKLASIEMKLKKMTALGFVSDEWVKWSPVTLGSFLVPKFGEAIGFKEDVAGINGKGGGQPLGILQSGCKIEVAKEEGQDPNTFVLENSTKMLARLRVKKDSAVCWLMNRTVLPQLPLFNISVGTGGTAVFTNNVSGKPGQALWGYPIVWTEKVPAIGTAGAVTLVDLSDYLLADDQSGPEIAQSIHLKFDYGQTAFRLTKYIDGQNETDTAFTPMNGDPLSPVVTLAA